MTEVKVPAGCSADEAVVDALRHWLAAGWTGHLVTVVTSWGSSPRPPGSLLAVRGDGRQAGSVSGGCVEADLVERLIAGEFPGERPSRTRYGVSRDEAARFGLPCGGTLELLVEPLGPAGAEDWEALYRAMATGNCVRRRVEETSGAVTLAADDPAAPDLDADEAGTAKRFGPAWRLLVIGAGQLAGYLAGYARDLGFGVTVCDPRPEALAGWQGTREALDTRMPDDAVAAFAPGARSAVVAATHDPKLDDLALMEALVSPAFYVGALGSRRNNDQRRQRLGELGLPPEAVSRLRGPMGLAIGSRTPPEIALAVAAEMTAVRQDGAVLAAAP